MTLRMLVAGGLCLITAWVFHSQAIVPLQKREQGNLRKIADLRERIETAGGAINEIRTLEQQTEKARAELNQFRAEQPAGSAVVWFPERMAQHFPLFGVTVAASRLGAILDEPGLPGYQRIYWAVGLNIVEKNQNLPGLLEAVADLESRYPFLKVIDFAIRPDSEDPRRRIATVNIAALVPK